MCLNTLLCSPKNSLCLPKNSVLATCLIKGPKPYPILVEVTSFDLLYCVLSTVFGLRICIISDVSLTFFVLLGISNACNTCVVLVTYPVCSQTFFFYTGNDMRNRARETSLRFLSGWYRYHLALCYG